MKLSVEKKHAIFKALATKPLLEVGMDFDFDKHYANKANIRQGVNRVYKEVLVEPEKFGITEEVVDLVKEGMASRKSMTTKAPIAPELDDMKSVDSSDIKGLIQGGRNKAAVLLHKKLDSISSSKKKLDEVNINHLATVLGILFDKGQIVQGEATENIAVLAKVSDSMTPEEQMEALLKMREKIIADKHDK